MILQPSPQVSEKKFASKFNIIVNEYLSNCQSQNSYHCDS